jgi:hypothetical protein
MADVFILHFGKVIAWMQSDALMADLVVGSDTDTAVAIVGELHNRPALEAQLELVAPLEPPPL